MKKVLNFVFWSFIYGALFATGMKIFDSTVSIFEFGYFLLFGPIMLSVFVVLSQKYNTKKQDKTYNYIETLFVNRLVLIISKYLLIIASISFVLFVGFAIAYGVFLNAIPNYIAKKDYNKAIMLAKVLDKTNIKPCFTPTLLTYINFKENNEEWTNYEQQALKCNKESYKTYIAISRISEKDNQYQYALMNLDKALKINEDSFNAMWGKQYIHFKMHDCENGIRDVENILNTIDKKGSKTYIYRTNNVIIKELLPDEWKRKVLKNLSTCPNSKEKEELIKKIRDKKD